METGTASIERLEWLEKIDGESWRLLPHAFAEVVSGGRWKAWRYLRYIGQRVALTIARGDGRLIINLPPGVGKSTFISKWVPICVLDADPYQRIISASHGAELATDWGRIVRNEFDTNELLTTKLREDSTAAHRWNTVQGGGMYAVGVGGGITGFRGNLILPDDPYPTWEAAQSATYRKRVIQWFDGTLLDRLEPHGSIILVMHRWNENDLAGYLQAKGGEKWEVIRLPALAEKNDPIDRAEGEALCPERFPVDALELTRMEVGEQVWQSKYQQNPLGYETDRVYFCYTPERNLDPGVTLRSDLPIDISFDFNRNPGMHAIIGQYDRREDVFTAVDEVYGDYMRLPDAPNRPGSGCLSVVLSRLKEWGMGKFPWPELRVFGDPSGTQIRAETTLTAWQQVQERLEPYAQSFNKPFRYKVARAQYRVSTRIDTFNAALCDSDGYVHYKVHPRCTRLVVDLKSLKPDELGLIDKADETKSHASEAEANRVCFLRPIRRITPTVGRVGVA